jgi:hypothetical protein
VTYLVLKNLRIPVIFRLFRKVTCVYNILIFDIYFFKLYVVLPLHTLYENFDTVAKHSIARRRCAAFQKYVGKATLKIYDKVY